MWTRRTVGQIYGRAEVGRNGSQSVEETDKDVVRAEQILHTTGSVGRIVLQSEVFGDVDG